MATSKLPMVNQQPVEKRVERTDGALDVVSVFKTIQGEGPLTGTPAVFVRTAGCSLLCPSCDTQYTDGRRVMTSGALLSTVATVDPGLVAKLIVLTGGEPFRQACGQFIGDAILAGYRVQVETNGTLFDGSLRALMERPGMTTYDDNFVDGLTIVCSPKTGSLARELLPWIDHLKYVVEAGKVDPEDGLPTDSLNFGVRPARPWQEFTGEVFVSPMDSQDAVKNLANRQAAVDSCMRFGYRLSLQTHKLLGLE